MAHENKGERKITALPAGAFERFLLRFHPGAETAPGYARPPLCGLGRADRMRADRNKPWARPGNNAQSPRVVVERRSTHLWATVFKPQSGDRA